MKRMMLWMSAVACMCAAANDVEKYDSRMALEKAVVSNGVKWVDGRYLPLEGRCFNDTAAYYDRLPAGVTTNVNIGVRGMKNHTSGMLFRFRTDSRRLVFRWKPVSMSLAMDHMPSTGVSGIDVYRQREDGSWFYVKTGRIRDAKAGGELSLSWTPGTACLVNLPLYNGVKEFTLGIDEKAKVEALGPRKSGVNKPVVFYGTSITHGGCASRPGLGFVNIVGRKCDVPVCGLGFSGSGRMELEMADHLARIDASCYILDCLWNMNKVNPNAGPGGAFHDIKHPEEPICVVRERYEPFIRALRAKRPDTPIIMAEQCDVYMYGKSQKDIFIRALYEKLIAEGWKNLVYLPKERMYTGDGEGTVDGCHPNDLGMMSMAEAFSGAVREALNLK